MADDVAVVHHDLHSKGGGEAVAMAVLEALQDRYDVTLVTLSRPDFDELNDYFNASVDDVAVRLAGAVAPQLNEAFGVRYYVLQNALLGRFARRHADEYDLLVSTINELGLDADSVQYVHFPFDWSVSLDNRGDIFHPSIEEDGLYERLCSAIAGVDGDDIRSNTLLANSEWTASVVEEAYDARAEVLYPPVDTRGFEPLPWTERERGFVTVGRIERSKRIAEQIEVVDRLRERGHDTHVHVVGPPVDEDYYEEVSAMASSRPHVHLEGELSRETLVDRICSHRYGIHGKEYEHFGMAVAELAAGGCVTFVPANGGQHEIVRDDAVLYDSVDDAVETADEVLSRSDVPDGLRWSLEEIRRRFGRERFKTEIETVVADALGRPTVRDGETPRESPAAAPSLSVEEATED